MKAQIPILLAGLMSALAVGSQTYTDLHNFPATSGNPLTNSDGANPFAGVILSNNVLYGTTYSGGSNGVGSVYSMHVDGSDFSNLYSFSRESGTPSTNTDGASPTCPLLLSSNVLFGTTYGGGVNGSGTIFRVDADGAHFTNLYSFPASMGIPRSELILLSNVLYGTASVGGAGFGSVFRINSDGTDFTNLVVFSSTVGSPQNPFSGLTPVNGVLYGATRGGGGTTNQGVIFAVNTDGTGYTNIFTFEPVVSDGIFFTNTTGADSFGTLVYSGGILYGTTDEGGANGNGTVFSVGTNGSNFNILHSFSATTNGANLDGANSSGALLLAGGVLYGTAVQGGTGNRGTVFSVNTNGSDFSVLYEFSTITNNSMNAGGYGPVGGLVMSGSTLYGATLFGGSPTGALSQGNIYSLSLSSPQPFLNFQVVGSNLVLSWGDPTFSLQTSPALGQSFAIISNSVSPYTTNLSGTQRYFRLKQN